MNQDMQEYVSKEEKQHQEEMQKRLQAYADKLGANIRETEEGGN